jgi:hypothetical protein
MLKVLDDSWWEGKYLYYKDLGRIKTVKGARGKTHRFQITSKFTGEYLGEIKWFSKFRKYTFWPSTVDSKQLVFDNLCLGELKEFCETQTQMLIDGNKEHVKKLKEKNRMAAARLRREQAEEEIKNGVLIGGENI